MVSLLSELSLLRIPIKVLHFYDDFKIYLRICMSRKHNETGDTGVRHSRTFLFGGVGR